MVKAIGGLSLMPSDTGAMPQKIHPNSCIEGKPENPGNPGVSRPSQAIFHPLSWEKSRKAIAVRINARATPPQISQVCHGKSDWLARTFRDVGSETDRSFRRGLSTALLASARAGTNTASSAGLFDLALAACGDGSSRA